MYDCVYSKVLKHVETDSSKRLLGKDRQALLRVAKRDLVASCLVEVGKDGRELWKECDFAYGRLRQKVDCVAGIVAVLVHVGHATALKQTGVQATTCVVSAFDFAQKGNVEISVVVDQGPPTFERVFRQLEAQYAQNARVVAWTNVRVDHKEQQGWHSLTVHRAVKDASDLTIKPLDDIADFAPFYPDRLHCSSEST